MYRSIIDYLNNNNYENVVERTYFTVVILMFFIPKLIFVMNINKEIQKLDYQKCWLKKNKNIFYTINGT